VFAGTRPGNPLGGKAATIVAIADLRPGPQRLLGDEVAGKDKDGTSYAGEKTSVHGNASWIEWSVLSTSTSGSGGDETTGFSSFSSHGSG
jgi:hypothetical protein